MMSAEHKTDHVYVAASVACSIDIVIISIAVSIIFLHFYRERLIGLNTVPTYLKLHYAINIRTDN